MKMCLAPCFKGCTDDEYMSEVRRVQKFLDSRGESLIHELEGEREKASAELEFEAAATVHAKIEKVRGVIRGVDEIIQRLDRLDAVIIQPSTQPNEVSLFRFTNGQLCGPQPFRVENILLSNERSGDSSLYAQPMMMQPVPEGPAVTSAAPASLETRLSDAIDEIHSIDKCTAASFAENLALLKRWYYKSARVGEIFFADAQGQFPMRKVAKGLSRVLVGMREKEDSPQASQ
jgi:excinuclease UvrABC nuclease subunit